MSSTSILPAATSDWSPLTVLRTCFATPALWHDRWVARRQLEELDAHTLNDVGLARDAIRKEARKPFWQR